MKLHFNLQSNENPLKNKLLSRTSNTANPNPRADTLHNALRPSRSHGNTITLGFQITTRNSFEPLSHSKDDPAKSFDDLVEAHEIRRQALLGKKKVEDNTQSAENGWQIIQRRKNKQNQSLKHIPLQIDRIRQNPNQGHRNEIQLLSFVECKGKLTETKAILPPRVISEANRTTLGP